MTESQKQRAEIKKEFQAIVTRIRKELDAKGFPKAIFTSAGMRARDMEGTIHCGSDILDSIRIAEAARKHKALLKHLKAYGATAKFERVKVETPSGRRDGKKKAQYRTQIRVIWHEAPDEGDQASEQDAEA